ncbi:hypothetical protein V496_01722 [Pseudogymnoascus sp. VKM F-4515 (FW-2607)]|nr:hypothetical protein V496_01722 [Pseudogymnoascus sp. VKM F-4515 (FW-2607)]KFY92836.1 hypothetical protein V498_04713 [Pseudogymnoascus sp. VKM F-4517 (FW-2822)]
MHSLLPVVVLFAICAKAVTDENDWREVKPNEKYINDMCLPRYSKMELQKPYIVIAELSNTPFPCEQEYFLRLLCYSNGTTPNDFLAEQQCLCGGNYFDTLVGCYNCGIAHGVIATPPERAKVYGRYSSLSKAECSPTPVLQPFTNLLEDFNSTSYMLRSDMTLSSNQFSSDTAVSNYWTGAAAPIAGKITGEAVHHQSSFTNINYEKFTPTAAATTGGSAATTSATTSTGSADEANSTGNADAASSTGNADAATSTGGAAEVKVAGGLLAAVIGMLAAL